LLQLHNKQKLDSAAGSLLVALLMHYPEIMSINLDEPQQQILFNFLLAGKPAQEELASFKELLQESFAAYAELSGERVRYKVKIQPAGKLSILGIKAGTKTLSPEGISLLCGLVCRSFPGKVVSDGEKMDAFYDDEDLLYQEETIAFLLKHGAETSKENLLAFREAGKVFVYDKQESCRYA